MKNILKFSLMTVVLLLSAFSAWVYTSTFHPDDEMPIAIDMSTDARLAPSDRPLKLLSWNIQFLAGNFDNHFFYSGGTDPWPSVARTEAVADELAALIKREDPDIILLQEIDLNADRTGGKNQVRMLQERLADRYPVESTTYYWKADYVPHPAVMGRAGMALAILSKYKLEDGMRYALPAISSDDIVTRQFNLKRAVQTAELPLQDGSSLTIVNTHLSAFAQGTDTMERQIARVMSVLGTLDQANHPWVMGGDFNLLMDTQLIAQVKTDDQWEYNQTKTELAPLAERYRSFPNKADTLGDARSAFYTHISATHPKRLPDKTIDYIFFSDTLSIASSKVHRSDALLISDHLPLVVEVQRSE